MSTNVERLLRELYFRESRKRFRLISDVHLISPIKENLPFILRLRATVASVKIWG